MDSVLIAEATFQKQEMNERHLLWLYSHFS